MDQTVRLGLTVMLLMVAVAAVAVAFVAISRTPEVLREAEAAPSEEPLGAGFGPSSAVIVEGDSAAAIGRRLLSSEAIDSHTRFELLALLLGWESRLEPGSYTFEAGLTTFEILRRIHFGETSPLRVVIPEGLRLEQVIERVAEASGVSAEALASVVADASTAAQEGTLAAQRPAGVSLEGYLFPSAYTFPIGVGAEEALRLMLLRFDDALNDQLRAQIRDSGWTLHEILTMASIIEREVVVDEERPLVAAVMWNRLAAGIPLQMDPTVQYAVGSPEEWWKRSLTTADLAVESEYNTYRVAGLPPTPIASPGLASIEAAANPANVPYLFFVARGDGTHIFSNTYEEHQANVERFQGGSE